MNSTSTMQLVCRASVGFCFIICLVTTSSCASTETTKSQRKQIMKREIIRVEPFDSNFEKWGVPVSTCTRAGDMIFISGLPPFDPKTGELLVNAPFEQQAERILEQLKTVLEAAGSDLEHVMKINVLCVSPERFKAFNEIYKRYFPNNPPARIFFFVPVWTGPFDIEIACIAVRKD